jgi:hypothetical protein
MEEEEEKEDVQPEPQKMSVGTKRGREASGVEQAGATGHIRLKVRKDFQAMDSDPKDVLLTSGPGGRGTGVGGRGQRGRGDERCSGAGRGRGRKGQSGGKGSRSRR